MISYYFLKSQTVFCIELIRLGVWNVCCDTPYVNTKRFPAVGVTVCAEVQTATMRRLARCLALIVIEITYLQIKCTDNMKASRGKFIKSLSETLTHRGTDETSRAFCTKLLFKQ